jgi:hypothetical protein
MLQSIMTYLKDEMLLTTNLALDFRDNVYRLRVSCLHLDIVTN